MGPWVRGSVDRDMVQIWFRYGSDMVQSVGRSIGRFVGSHAGDLVAAVTQKATGWLGRVVRKVVGWVGAVFGRAHTETETRADGAFFLCWAYPGWRTLKMLQGTCVTFHFSLSQISRSRPSPSS